MENILKLLGVDKLEESDQTAITQKFNDLVDLKVKEKVNEQLESEKASLLEYYEGKFETYKEEITDKFSSFLDNILEEELQIPEKIQEFARKGELYHDLIEEMKLRIAIDEDTLDEEARNLLSEAKEELVNLKNQYNELFEKYTEVSVDAKEFAADLYKHDISEGLPVDEKESILALLEGISDKEEIDRKFALLVESGVHKKKKKEKEEEHDEDEDEDDKKCNECGEAMKECKCKKEGKGLSEVKEEDDSKEKINESPSKTYFDKQMEEYLGILKTGTV
jgi:hypothetical protein